MNLTANAMVALRSSPGSASRNASVILVIWCHSNERRPVTGKFVWASKYHDDNGESAANHILHHSVVALSMTNYHDLLGSIFATMSQYVVTAMQIAVSKVKQDWAW
jgi:hypothetical protein